MELKSRATKVLKELEEAARLRDRLYLQSRARAWRDRRMGHKPDPRQKPPGRPD